MKFKVGDKVKIRKGSLAGNIYTKRAKEIAFEEQAQKMAKEMIEK